MTTLFFNPVVSSTSDANFRAWGSDFSSRLSSIGLIQTSDTGQINWTTVTRPAVNDTAAGYEIWRYPNSYIFLKFEYGRSQNLDVPRMWLTVGKGSNGSGTLTGVVSERNGITRGDTTWSPGTYNSWLCFKDNYLGLLGWRFSDWTYQFFAICPTVNANGIETTDGVQCYFPNPSNNTTVNDGARTQYLNFVTNTAATAVNAAYCIVPLMLNSSVLPNSDIQCFAHWMFTPQVRPNLYVTTVIRTEISVGATFTTAIVGTTPRTYLATSNISVMGASGPFIGQSMSNTKIAILWE